MGDTSRLEEILDFAVQREQQAGSADDPKIRKLFLGLAQEEARHKLRFELEYDDSILTGN